jgi:hypothetical protein
MTDQSVRWAKLCIGMICMLGGAYFALLWVGHSRPWWMAPAMLVLLFLFRKLRRDRSEE